jgi:hypothetical protein
MELVGFDHAPQDSVRTDQMLLTHELGQRAGPHAVRQGRASRQPILGLLPEEVGQRASVSR